MADRCPACNQPGIDWNQKYTRDNEDNPDPITCSHCGAGFRVSGTWRLIWIVTTNGAFVAFVALNDHQNLRAGWILPVALLVVGWWIALRWAPLVRIKGPHE